MNRNNNDSNSIRSEISWQKEHLVSENIIKKHHTKCVEDVVKELSIDRKKDVPHVALDKLPK
tara:strand:+ start:39 stop:224 length:186 start_codon:yes stop_codon:yes gene_type:complete